MDEALRRIDAESVWLNPWVGKYEALALLQLFAADLMAAIPASTRANSTRNEDPQVVFRTRRYAVDGQAVD